eukprot:1523757-Rhodomonas_salina.2
MVLRSCYGMSGTESGYGATRKSVSQSQSRLPPYALSSTVLSYGARPCPVLAYRSVLGRVRY